MSSKLAERVVFTGDFLRPFEDKFASHQRGNILWLSRLLGWQVALATGLRTETVAWCAGSSREANLGDADISAIYEEFGVPQSVDGWAALYARAGSSATLDAIAQRHFAGTLVLGFELPPVFVRALLRHGATIIDVCVHPVRFLDDIFLGFRTSEPALRESFARHAVREDFLRLMAGVQGAAAVTKSSFTLEPESLVIFDQTPNDAVRIAGGQFARLEDFREAVVRTAAGYAKVYFKNHPYAPESEALAALRDWGVAAEATDENAYYLMAHPNVRGVLSLSSSACTEAVYFGKEAHFLLGPPRRLAVDGAIVDSDSYIGIRDAFLDVDFWREVLGCVLPVTVRDCLTVPEKPNRLRLSSGGFWGYNQIDSDGYIAAAMQVRSPLAKQAEEARSALAKQAEETRSALAKQAEETRSALAKQAEETRSALAKQAEETRCALAKQAEERRSALTTFESWLANETIYRRRSLLGRMLFRRDGRPTRGLRLALFHKNGAPRGIFRPWVIGKDGIPRKSLRQWMSSAEYIELPKAYHAPTAIRA